MIKSVYSFEGELRRIWEVYSPTDECVIVVTPEDYAKLSHIDRLDNDFVVVSVKEAYEFLMEVNCNNKETLTYVQERYEQAYPGSLSSYRDGIRANNPECRVRFPDLLEMSGNSTTAKGVIDAISLSVS